MKRVYTRKNLLQFLGYIFSIIIYVISESIPWGYINVEPESGGRRSPMKIVGVRRVPAFPLELSPAYSRPWKKENIQNLNLIGPLVSEIIFKLILIFKFKNVPCALGFEIKHKIFFLCKFQGLYNNFKYGFHNK